MVPTRPPERGQAPEHTQTHTIIIIIISYTCRRRREDDTYLLCTFTEVVVNTSRSLVFIYTISRGDSISKQLNVIYDSSCLLRLKKLAMMTVITF